ncbi:VIER F-box protein 2 [Tanacetum coccineum]
MTKVIKEEFEKLESLKISDDSLTCNTSLEIFHKEFNRMSRMDDDLFTYEVEIRGSDDDIEYDQSDIEFTEWLASKFYNHKTIDQYTKNALWIYYTRGNDEVELLDEESFDSDNEDEVAEILGLTLIGHMEWPTSSWKDDGYCNGGNLLGAYIVGNTLYYQDLEWYEALEDGKLKDEALKNKAIMKGIIDEDDESHYEVWRRWDGYKNAIHDHEERENKEEHGNKERCELFDNPHHDAPVCNIRRFEMIKYSFGEDEEYVAIKEHEYDDLTSINEDACRTYQEIFLDFKRNTSFLGNETLLNFSYIKLLSQAQYVVVQIDNLVHNFSFKRKKHGRMMLDSIDNGPLVYPTVEENRQTRPKKYSELTEAQQLQDDCDVQATNIILHGLPPDGETLRERYPDSLAFVANSPTLYNPSQSPRNLGYSMYLPPQQFTPVYGAPIHHQHHRTPINPTLVSLFLCFSKEMIRLIAQQSILHVVARSIKSYAGTGNIGIATTSKGNVRVGPQRVMKCYNCQGEGHMVRQCTQPKRPRMLHGFKEKLMLIEAQERNLAFQPDDLDAYDSNCDDLSSAKAILMENLSSCDLEVLSEGGVVSLKWGIDGGWGGGDPVRGSLVGDKGEMSVIGFAVFVFKGVKFRRLIGVGDIRDVKKSCVNDCKKHPELEIELFKKKDFVE